MGFKPVVKETTNGAYMLGAVAEGKPNETMWYFSMTTADIATLYTYGVKVVPGETNTRKTSKWSGQLIFETHHEAFLIWERFWVPKLLAEELAK